MGIRESFQENPPGEKDLNIHDIVIEKDEKPKEKLPFDPDVDITDKDRELMVKHLEYLRRREEEVRGETNYGKDVYDSFVKIIQQKEILRAELDKDFVEWVFYKSKDYPGTAENHDYRVGDNYFKIASLDAVTLALLLSGEKEYAGRLCGHKDMRWKAVKTELSKVAEEAVQLDNCISWGDFFYTAAALKILFRDRAKEFNLLLDEQMWDTMKDKLNRINNPSYRRGTVSSLDERKDFAVEAMAMTILAAEGIEITEKGITLTMHKPKKEFKTERKTPRPERRQF